MPCPRCLGLLVPVASLLHESNGDYPFLASDRHENGRGWACLNCGHRTDPVIARNRAAQLGLELARLVKDERAAAIQTVGIR